ncbi:MAG: AraC family transcriptional regulator ligand-binding domain-containing protein, partial [Proteobacteria bacterium]|nr:AraC family transcriptional regulator ligand-binding domain-containing protein [Pseudomonadota bacterium]
MSLPDNASEAREAVTIGFSADAQRPRRTADLPLLHQRIFAPYKLANLLDAALEHGLAADTVLAGASISLDRIHDPHARTSVSDYLTACENIVAAGADPHLALDVGARLHLSAYGMYGYALMCSPTMRDFFDFAVRYHLLAGQEDPRRIAHGVAVNLWEPPDREVSLTPPLEA